MALDSCKSRQPNPLRCKGHADSDRQNESCSIARFFVAWSQPWRQFHSYTNNQQNSLVKAWRCMVGVLCVQILPVCHQDNVVMQLQAFSLQAEPCGTVHAAGFTAVFVQTLTQLGKVACPNVGGRGADGSKLQSLTPLTCSTLHCKLYPACQVPC